MSLIVLDKKQKPPKGAVLIGKTSSQSIYHSSNVEKNSRIKEIELNESIEFYPYIHPGAKQRSATYISGLSGSGKSTLAVKLVQRLRELRPQGTNKQTKEPNPEKKLVLFTITQQLDPAFAPIKNMAHVYFAHPEFVQITLEMLQNNIVIFDDWTSIIDKRLQKYVQGFITDMLERARKLEIDIIVITHQTQAHHQTKAIIFECDGYAVNLQTNRNASVKFLKNYMELDKKDLQEVVDLDSNNMFAWTYFRKSYPQMYIHDNKIKLL